MRLLTIISGVLLVLTGVFCFANPGETFLSLAFILGFIMVINSIIQGIAYWWGRSGNQNDNNGWILTEAIITFILGLLVLSNQIAADVAIPMVFGMWVMFSGILRVVTATTINRANKRSNFMWTLVTGLVCAAGGLYAFLNPIIAGFAIAILLGIMFVLQGISTLELGIHMPHEKKEPKPKQSRQPRQSKPEERSKQDKQFRELTNRDTRPVPVQKSAKPAEKPAKPAVKPAESTKSLFFGKSEKGKKGQKTRPQKQTK